MRAWLFVLALGGCHWAFGIAEQPPVPPDGPPPPPGRWSSISTGIWHACGLDVDGRALCWGSDRYGQLGAGASSSLIPQAVDASTWTALAAGTQHTCGIKPDGHVWCWGRNGNGQVNGVPSSVAVKMPVAVALPIDAPPVDEIGGGTIMSCARAGSHLYCWGDPRETTGTPLPTEILPGTAWLSVAVGFDHVCAIDAGHALWCWGANRQGQTGSMRAVNPVQPSTVALPGGRHALSVSAGTEATCAVLSGTSGADTGEIWCWGSSPGAVNPVDPMHPEAPQQLVGGASWSSVVVGNNIACGISGGMATCWGSVSGGGLGDGVWSEAILPTAATRSFRADAISIARGYDAEESVCAIADHDVACWGDNRGGQLGIPATLHLAPSAVPSPTGTGWTKVAAGNLHTCASDAQGALYCWGANESGQVTGAPCATASCDVASPFAETVPASPAIEIVAGAGFSCALVDTAIRCWGTNVGGQLGIADAAATTSLRAVAPGTHLIGGGHGACDQGPSTPLECWGTINLTPQHAASTIPSLDAVIGSVYDVSFGDNSACAIGTSKQTGSSSVRACWGFNYQSEFGDGKPAPATQVTPIPPMVQSDQTTLIAISMTSWHGCAVTGTRGVDCWGSDYALEAGQEKPDLAVEDVTVTPKPVGSLAACKKTSTSFDYSCALCSDTVACWGSYKRGQLGRDVDFTGSDFAPMTVAFEHAAMWTDLGSGDMHSCAVAVDGTLACWGLGVRGQLGDGSHGSSLPVAISTP